jgi:phosphopentomutase
VIARPFVGAPGHFARTENRRDFSLVPPGATILDAVKDAGLESIGVGKIEDIFAHRGLTQSEHTGNNTAGVDATIAFLKMSLAGLIFTNLVDFDSVYGHRSNPRGYADALEAFDARLPEILASMRVDDVLIITADHGNDPTDASTDHTRERVPILIAGRRVRRGYDLGTRNSFADVAATIAELLGIPWYGAGRSFALEILKSTA